MAGNRCPQCNKFVSCDYEAEVSNDPEVTEQFDGELEIITMFTIKKVCSECGEELAVKEVESVEHTNKSDFEESC